MSTIKRISAVFCLLCIATLACSLSFDLGLKPVITPTQQISGFDHVATMVNQTFQALTQQAPTATPTITLTPTLVHPLLTVSMDTNCYSGPGTGYGLVITLHPGTIAIPIGKGNVANYWVIETPNYPGSTCWLSDEYASVTGDTNSLPEVAAPEKSTYTLSEPKSLNVSCTSQSSSSTPAPHDSSIWTVVFRWKNTEPDQQGVRVYRNGRQIATLGAHASSYTDYYHRDHRRSDVTYGVQVFNGLAVSSIRTIDIRHCPED